MMDSDSNEISDSYISSLIVTTPHVQVVALVHVASAIFEKGLQLYAGRNSPRHLRPLMSFHHNFFLSTSVLIQYLWG